MFTRYALILLFWYSAIAFARVEQTQFSQACLESGDADYPQEEILKSNLASNEAAANILLDSGQLRKKLRALDFVLKDPTYLVNLKMKYYPPDQLFPTFMNLPKGPSGEITPDQILGYYNSIPFDLRVFFEKASRDLPIYPPDFEAATHARWVEQNGKKTEIFASAQAKFANHACDLVVSPAASDYGIRLKGCMNAADFLIDQTSTKEVGGEQVSFLPIFNKILIDPVYAQSYALLAVRILAKVDVVAANPDSFERTSKNMGDFFDDIVNSFETVDPQSGHEVAVQRAFETMALYSARGVGFTFLTYLSGKENLFVGPSLQIIAAAANILNRASLFSGKAYAFPQFIKTSCQIDRPYHFWMGAYLARLAMQTGKYEPIDIYYAIHAMRVAYKLIGPTSVWQEYFMAKYRTVYTEETQKDLVFGALGVFGILKSPSLDFRQVSGSSIPTVDADSLLLSQWNASQFNASAASPSVLDNLPLYIKPFVLSSFQTFDTVSGISVDRGDRQWSAGVQPNYAFKKLIPLLVK